MNKFFMVLVSFLFIGSLWASDTTKVNLKGTNKVKHYELKVNSTRTVVLRGVVQDSNIEALKREIIIMKEADNKLPIFIIINSPGGSVLAGFEFVTLLKSIPNTSYCIIESEAFSMAAIISQYCTKTYIHKYGSLMFHQAAYGVEGSVSQVNSRVGFMNDYIKTLEDDLVKQMGMSYVDYKTLTADEWWTTATEAVKLGLVDGIVDELYYTAQPPAKQFSLFDSYQGNIIKNPAR